MKRINENRIFFDVFYTVGPGKQTKNYIAISTADLPYDITLPRLTVDMMSQLCMAIHQQNNRGYITVTDIVYIEPGRNINMVPLRIDFKDPYIIPPDSPQVTMGYRRSIISI